MFGNSTGLHRKSTADNGGVARSNKLVSGTGSDDGVSEEVGYVILVKKNWAILHQETF
jgi:hypothetical protein